MFECRPNFVAFSRRNSTVVDRWMSSNRLKLNTGKTEFIWLGTRKQLAKLSVSPLQIKNQVIMPLDEVRDLGVIVDNKLTMESHSANVARSCFYQLRQLRTIRCLTTDARRTLVTAFVAGRVDYCNAVLYGTSTAVTRRLQMVLNAAARLVVGIVKYSTGVVCSYLSIPTTKRAAAFSTICSRRVTAVDVAYSTALQ